MAAEAPVQFVSMDWLSQTSWPAMIPDAPEVRIADLFCGCGGLTLGAIQALRAGGCRPTITLAVDTSSSAAEVYRQNFGVDSSAFKETPIEELFDGSVHDAPTPQEISLANRIPHLDLLLAGPPCQGHSDLNNRSRRKDERNLLYLKAIRAAEILRPKTIIIENVPSIIHDKYGVIEKSYTALESIGYFITTAVINVLSLGLPQNRKRHLLIAARSGKYLAPISEKIEKKNLPPLAGVISDIIDEAKTSNEIFRTPSRVTDKNRRRITFLFENGLYDLPNEMRPPCHQNALHSYKSMYGRLRWNEPAQTITTGFGCMGQGRFVHPKRRRTLTPHEAARIQGFPDFFSFQSAQSRTRLHELIGNAVPPVLASVVVEGILKQELLKVRSDAKEAA